ncbi:MAG: potassium transporter TrkG [Bacillota bacterium]|nr:potassium transporter TrkG [Bacillota bacterium]
MKTIKKSFHASPSQTIMAGFAFMILIGAFLLNLPVASQNGESVGFINALFTATSANCVTGLVVVPTATQWSLFGKIVILILIQLGGLGFMTVITLAMLFVRRKISLRSRKAIQASFNQDDIGGMIRLVKKVFKITLLFELIGAIFLAAFFYFQGMNHAGTDIPGISGLQDMTVFKALWLGLFHSVSAFCNAGFDIIGDSSIVPFQSGIFLNIVLMILIVSGGLGFTVWEELLLLIRNPRRHALRIRLRRLSLHTKIVLIMTISLILIGWGMFLLFESSNPETLALMNHRDKGLAALFQSVTLRTAGFNSIPQENLTEMSKFVSSMLMLVGGSPVSTAGGMKTVSMGVILLSMYALLRNRSKIEALGRTLPLDVLQKALTVAATMSIVVFASVVLLYFTEGGRTGASSLIDLVYETCSAAGTVGVTVGVTSRLSVAGKIVIMICMYLGRLSPVTVMVALNRKINISKDAISMPEERVIIG